MEISEPTKLTLRFVWEKLKDHLQFHNDNLNQRVDDIEIIIFGKEKTNGMVVDIPQIKKDLDAIKKIGWSILFILVADFLAKRFGIGG